MSEDNGQHRKPWTIRAAFTGAGLLTAVTILPLFVAGNASAATTAQWDAVAQCESGGVWNLPYGDASSTGGLQIQQPTWIDYGGLAYAAHPYQATKAQQIAIGEKILRGQGPGAWATVSNGCAAPTATMSNFKPGGQSAPTPAPKPVIKPAPVTHTYTPAKPHSVVRTYTVKPGDCLSKIALAHGMTHWGPLYQANKALIGSNPNLIYPGQVLTLP